MVHGIRHHCLPTWSLALRAKMQAGAVSHYVEGHEGHQRSQSPSGSLSGSRVQLTLRSGRGAAAEASLAGQWRSWSGLPGSLADFLLRVTARPSQVASKEFLEVVL